MRYVLLSVLFAAPLGAQDLCEGNGHGAAYMDVGPAYIGGYYELDFGSPNAPLSIAILSISDGFALDVHPTVGALCLDVHTPAYHIFVFPTDAAGNVHLPVYLPAVPTLVGFAPFYSNAATFEGGAWSLSKTVPLWFENPNSWTPASAMSIPRLYHTATYLGADGHDGRIRILIAGGGGGTVTVPIAAKSTEIFDPLGRAFAPGPDMSVERSTHTATRLDDGRVLLAGGLDTAGVCHASCEIFDLSSGTLTPTGAMTAPRAGHTATLLDDGRVLVAGGFADYQNPTTAWMAALDTAQATAEIYDPATGTWSTLAQTMLSKRAGHTATKLADGRVLLVGGVNGGTFVSFGSTTAPLFTGTCEVFDPATDTLAPTATLLGGGAGARGFHGASLLGNGHVLVTGGNIGGAGSAAISTNSSVRWDGAAWHVAPALPVEVGFHSQIALDDGRALVCGGYKLTSDSTGGTFVAKAFAAAIDGTTYEPLSPIGLNVGIPGSAPLSRGAMEAVRMHDGAVLFTGGTSTIVHDAALIYTPGS
jgi:hypothetical protein